MDREVIIKLSRAIDTLRAQVRESEAQLARRREQLAEAETQLDDMIGVAKRERAFSAALAGASPATLVGDAMETRTRANNDLWRQLLVHGAATSLRDQLIDIFHQAPKDKSFTAQELVLHMLLPKEKEPAMRQALKRLRDEGFLIREKEGLYAMNPVYRMLNRDSKG